MHGHMGLLGKKQEKKKKERDLKTHFALTSGKT